MKIRSSLRCWLLEYEDEKLVDITNIIKPVEVSVAKNIQWALGIINIYSYIWYRWNIGKFYKTA